MLDVCMNIRNDLDVVEQADVLCRVRDNRAHPGLDPVPAVAAPRGGSQGGS